MTASRGMESSLWRRMIPTPATIMLVGSLIVLIVAGWQKPGGVKLAVSALAGLLLVGALIKIFGATDFTSPRLGNGTPRQLAWIRIIVCLIAFILTVIEDLPAISWWPAEFQRNVQFFGLLNALPGYVTLVSSAQLLAVLQWTTSILLLLGMVGLGTRLTLPLAGLCFLLFQAILRHYTYFFHTGLVPLYLLCLLSWTPCAVAWSLDSRLNPAKRKANRQSIAFGVYACLIVLAIVYVLCGLSKIRSGLDWFRPENLQHKLLQDALRPIFLDYQWKPTIWLVQHDAPGFTYTTIGIFGVVIELGYFTVLFSRTARLVMPILALGLHTAILVFQHILFLDLLLVQLVFVNADQLAAFVSRRFRLSAAAANSPAASDSGEEGKRLRPTALVSMAALIAGLFIVWVFRIEYYPLSSWGMYSSIETNTPIIYDKMVANLEDGRSIVVPRRDYCAAVMPNSFSTLQKAFYTPWALGSFDRFLSAYVAQRNKNLAFGSPISSIQIQRWRWNYAVDPHDPRLGWMLDSHDYDVAAGKPEGRGSRR